MLQQTRNEVAIFHHWMHTMVMVNRFVLIRLHRFMMGFNQRQTERRQTQTEFLILCFPSDKFVVGHRLQDVLLFSFKISLQQKLFSLGNPSLTWCIARDLKGKQTWENIVQTFIYQSNQICSGDVSSKFSICDCKNNKFDNLLVSWNFRRKTDWKTASLMQHGREISWTQNIEWRIKIDLRSSKNCSLNRLCQYRKC